MIRYLLLSSLVLFTLNTAGFSQTYRYETLDHPSGASTHLQDINNVGAIVGSFALDEEEFGQSFLWQDGVFTSPDVAGVIDFEFTSINDAGVIAGIGVPDEEPADPLDFVSVGYTLDNGIVDTFSFPGAFFTFPFTVANDGTVTGSFFDLFTEASGAFRKQGDSIERIPTPGYSEVILAAANDMGTTIGFGFPEDEDAAITSFVIRDEDFQLFAHPDGETELYAINNMDAVVGTVFSDGGVSRDFVYDGSAFIDLAFPGAELTEAWGINDLGVIVGEYTLPGSDNTHGFIATPVPEPTGFVAVMSSCLPFLFRRRETGSQQRAIWQ